MHIYIYIHIYHNIFSQLCSAFTSSLLNNNECSWKFPDTPIWAYLEFGQSDPFDSTRKQYIS